MQEDEFTNYHNDNRMEKIVFVGNHGQQLLQEPVEDWKHQQQHKPATNHVRVSLQQTQNDKARITPLANFFYAEDLRISRILRRLMMETNPTAAVEICEKLEIAVQSPSNAAYISRSIEMILDNFAQILKQCPVQCLQQVSNILGTIGYISRTNFPVYKNFITKTYQNSKSVRKYLMLALKSTFRCDAVNLDLMVYSERVLELLIEYLENAEKADTFIAISDTIVEFSKNYRRAFIEHFTDVVDIVVGWHLETDQPQTLKLHCALVLQKWAPYFLNELDFTYGLLGQFLEDINAWLEDLTAEDSNKKILHKAELRIAAFIGAFTTILKSLSTPVEFIGITADYTFIDNAVNIILRAAKEAFSLACAGEEIVYNVNDFLSSLLAHKYEFNNISRIEGLIKLEIEQLGMFNAQQIQSLLYTILCLLRHQRTSLSISVITMILDKTSNPLDALKYSRDELTHKLLLKIYHEILMLKNVPLLQEAYKHIKLDINDAVGVLENASDKKEYNAGKFSCTVQKMNFYLSALAVLATQTSSIISMYALDPSILELLIQNCKAFDVYLWKIEPTLHNALLRLLAVHCQKSHNFITTSRLLNDQQYASQVLEEQSRSSPTSEHFIHILLFFASILSDAEKISLTNLNLLLDWLHQLLMKCREHMMILLNNDHFLRICKNLSRVSLIEPRESAKCIRVLLTTQLPIELQTNIRNTAIYHLNSNDNLVTQTYAHILGNFPLCTSLAPINLSDGSAKQLSKIFELEKWYRGTTHFAPLRVKFFKEFLDFLDLPSSSNTLRQCEAGTMSKKVSPLVHIFSMCFINQTEHEKATQYQAVAQHQSSLIISWLQCETARYCVRNKLRTTVGKPQETFLAIEAIVMKYARMLALKDTKDRQHQSTITWDNAQEFQFKARMLLGFLECLEKHIYNAAQGTAFALPPIEKPAKTFFRINASTCKEWFKRIRPAVCLIATHCMEPEMIIRYSEQTLMKTDQTNSSMLENTLINLVGAHLQRNESESLHGLYTWVRTHIGKNLTWIHHAAEQASGHLELASTGYKSLLGDINIRTDGAVKQFVLEQLLHCLYYTGQWKEIPEILKQYVEKDESLSFLANIYSEIHLATVQTLCHGYQNEMNKLESETSVDISNALLQLMDWSTWDQSQTKLLSFSSPLLLRKVEDICMVKTLRLDENNHLPRVMTKSIQDGLRVSLSHGSNLDEWKIGQSREYIFINHVIEQFMDNEEGHIVSKIDNNNIHDSTMLLKYLLWTLLSELRTQANGIYLTSMEKVELKLNLFLSLATNAREEGNYNYCRTMLQRFFSLKGLSDSLEDTSLCLQNNVYKINVSDESLLRGISELSKCIYSTPDNSGQTQQSQYEAINLSSSLCLQIVEQVAEGQENLPYPTVGAETLLTLSDWLGQRSAGTNYNGSYVNLKNLPKLQELLKQLPETSVQLTDDELNVNMPAVDKAVGRLINASISQRNDSGEAWLAYGNWCYRWGKKLVELKNSDNQTLPAQMTDQCLSERDLKDIKNTFKQAVSDEVLLQVANILERHQLGSKSETVDDEIETNDIGSVEMIEQELRQLQNLGEVSGEEITGIIRIWRRTHKTVYAYYETAIRAYLKYLSIETSSGSSSNDKNKVEDSGFVTTTLRLLRLVVKHAFALQDVLEEGLNTTPLRPWRVIIPQLFSRLNHHEPYVRNSLAQLLCRLAQQEPHAVIFPAVVGSQEEGNLNNSQETSLISAPTTIALSNCFSSLVSKLSIQAPETVRHVQLLVKELRRVALLWEEYWLHTLGRLLTEYSSIFSGLVIETRKCNRNSVQQMEKLKAKHELLLQYVIADLKKIESHTKKSAETKYEQSFKEHYQHHIQQTLEELAQPEIVVAGPIESWQKLKNLYQRFQQRSMHTSIAAASTLKISDLSPILANMHDTAISMPGINSNDGEPVYIKSIESTVHILPTKTRPKKLSFLGSDGRKYTYLFKGLEDLHLDERIMQFLSISNLMMERTQDRRHHTQPFRAHHYSVIPLGPQSGLISWVDGVTPLFGIYKKWQQRDAVLKQQQNKERPNTEQQNVIQQPSSASSQLTALRPSELFYKKLRPLLTAQNIKLKDPRKNWPLGVLRRVLDELTEETPNDLLSKELWCHATSAAEWRKTVRNYSTSMAVMSVIGYIIGLGDRHLDNVLINLVTGEIVHIDYNVCFEKGKTLRVPEKVPFRLTPNLENALGVTGVEGSFRLGCEYVLRTLRKEKETLLTLLEAFVYDPLVDWTVSDDGVSGGTTRATLAYTAMQSVTSLKLGVSNTNIASVLSRESPLRVSKQYEMVQRRHEWELMQQTIKARFEDMRSHWSEYMNDIQQQLSRIENTSEELSGKLKSLFDAEEEQNKLNHQVAMIRELEMLGTAIGSHSLNTITQRFQAYKQDEEALETLRKSAQIAHKDIKTLLNTYFNNIIGKGNELMSMQSELTQQEKTVYINEFELVRDYIQEISEKLFEDANFARIEMDNSLHQEARKAVECIKFLDQYSRIMEFYPRTILQEKNGLFRYAEWYQQLWSDDLTRLKSEVKRCRVMNSVGTNHSEIEKAKCVKYANLMKKKLFELERELREALIIEAELEHQEIPTLESIITEIKNLASLKYDTCSMVQGEILLFLTETLIHLDRGDKSPNLFKEIRFIKNLEYIFEQLQLTPKSFQQLSEQKLLKALRNVLQALHDLEQDLIFERIVRLFFLDDNRELQINLSKLCKGDIYIQKSDPEKNDGLHQLHSLLTDLQNNFNKVEMELQQLNNVIKEILEIEACSWYNILLERLCIIHNLNESELNMWRKEAITGIFSLARDQFESFKTHCSENVYDVRPLLVPVGNFVTAIYSKYLNRVTIALSEAYISSFQTNVEYFNCFYPDRVECRQFVASIQRDFELAQIRLQIEQKTQCLEHYKHVTTAFIWVNQSMLEDTSNFTHVVVKENLLSIIRGVNQSLSVWKHTIVKIQSDLVQHTEIFQQHLGWIVAGNANTEDDINKIISRFKESSAAQNERYNFFLELAVKLIDHASVLLQFETLMDDSVVGLSTRQKTEGAFRGLIDDWEEVRTRYSQSSAAMTPVEKSIVQLLDPEDKIDACWIANITGLLDEMMFGVQKNLSSFEDEIKILQDRLYVHANELQNLIDNPLRTDMRQLLRLIIKNAKYPNRSGVASPNFAEEACLTNLAREVLQLLKVLSGKLGDLKTKLCIRDDYNDELLEQLNEKVKEVRNTMNQHLKELGSLVTLYLDQNHSSVRSNNASPAHVASPVYKKEIDDPTTAQEGTSVGEKKGEQKRNAYAVSVWKRIRMKLEGRDPDANRRSSIAEQVDFIINEATNRDNLAVLYEGWTPWV